MKGPQKFTLNVRVEQTDGGEETTRRQVIEALSIELDGDIETEAGAVLNVIVTAADYIGRAR